MPTSNQLVNQARLTKTKRIRTPALMNSPQKKGVCLRVYTKSPKKPNSAVRKIAKIKLTYQNEIIAYEFLLIALQFSYSSIFQEYYVSG